MAEVYIDGVKYVPGTVIKPTSAVRLTAVMDLPTVREESEPMIVMRTKMAVSRSNWEVGECAAIWLKRFSRSRGDAEFADLVGLTTDQIYQRRRVWETFADVYQNFPHLLWGHFYAALDWKDAAECLQWAEDVQAGVAEMMAWRRAQHSDDGTLPF